MLVKDFPCFGNNPDTLLVQLKLKLGSRTWGRTTGWDSLWASIVDFSSCIPSTISLDTWFSPTMFKHHASINSTLSGNKRYTIIRALVRSMNLPQTTASMSISIGSFWGQDIIQTAVCQDNFPGIWSHNALLHLAHDALEEAPQSMFHRKVSYFLRAAVVMVKFVLGVTGHIAETNCDYSVLDLLISPWLLRDQSKFLEFSTAT